MNLKHLLTKALLVVAMLCVGVSNVWGQKTYTTVFEQDYTGSDFASGWSAATASRVGWAQYTRTDVSGSDKTALLVFHNGNNNGASSTYSTLNSFNLYTSSTDSKVEFDIALQGNYGTTAYTASFTVNLSGGSKIDFSIYNKKESGADYNSSVTYTPNGGNATTLCTLYQDNTGTEQSSSLSSSNAATNFVLTKVYHVTITSDETNGVSITIDGDMNVNGNGETTVSATINSSFERVSTLVFNSGRNGGQQIMLDNLIASIHSEAEIVPNPSAAITGVNGTNRTVTMTLGTGSSDGTVIKYYTDTESKSDLATYSAPFTVSTSSTIYYYAESTSGATSDEQSINVTCGALTLNAPTITRSSNTTVTISDDQSDLDALPASTIYYSYNGSEYTPYTSAITVTADATVSAYSTATGYTQSATATRAVAPFPPTGFVQIENTPTDKSDNASSHSFATETTTTEKATYAAMLLKDGTQWGKNVYLQTADGRWGIRNGNNWYVQSTSWLMMKSMKAGEIIVVKSDYKSSSLVNATYSEKYSFGNEFAYIVDGDGDVEIGLTKPSDMHYFYGIYAYSNNYVSVTVSDAGMATYVNNDYDLDFSETEIKAYKVKVSTKGKATLVQVDNVPAGTPVLLVKQGGADETIPVMTGAAAVEDNDLVAGAGTAVATIDGDYTNMILNNVSGIGFYFANGQTVATNRAYLHIATSLAPDAVSGSARMSIVFDDAPTGIETISGDSAQDNGCINLSGQRVSQPTKGLYIVNGKKVLVK